MADDWSYTEVEATVSDYFEMLAMELRGESFNKAEHNRNLQRRLMNRSRGAIEKKHMNISAVLRELGFPPIDGYKPQSNYQALLYRVITERLPGEVGLHQAAAAAVERKIEMPPAVGDLLAILVNPPDREQDEPKLYERAIQVRAPIRRNYLEMESRNRTLGLAGEKLVLEFEHKRLWQAGKRDLANRIEHVADNVGDHLGCDISSIPQKWEEMVELTCP